MEHEASKGHEVQARQYFGQTLVVASKPAEARGPGEVALDDPATRQQHKAALGLGQLDDFEPDAMGGGICCGLLAGVALVHIGHLHVLASGLLHGSRQRGDLGTVLFVGRRDEEREQVA